MWNCVFCRGEMDGCKTFKTTREYLLHWSDNERQKDPGKPKWMLDYVFFCSLFECARFFMKLRRERGHSKCWVGVRRLSAQILVTRSMFSHKKSCVLRRWNAWWQKTLKATRGYLLHCSVNYRHNLAGKLKWMLVYFMISHDVYRCICIALFMERWIVLTTNASRDR